MADFSSLLSKPAGEAKKPPALDAGAYPGIIKSYEVGDNNQKRTPYVRFHWGITGWPGEAQTDESGAVIDLSKRQLRSDFYLTDDALWRLDAFMREVGINMEPGQTYAEVLPTAVGTTATLHIVQELNQRTNDTYNTIENITKAE
jgi:hypothetical protein